MRRLASDVGEVDIRINNAGISRFAPTAEFDAAAFDKMFASGVRVNAITPGPVYTPTPSGPEFIKALGETTPMHRASQPEEIAEVIAFLASPLSELHHRHDRRRRRRTQSDLTSASSLRTWEPNSDEDP